MKNSRERKKKQNRAKPAPQSRPEDSSWTFLTNHSHVLLCMAREPKIVMRVVAEQVGITERAVQRIVSDLEQAGYLRKTRRGRQNFYQIYKNRPLRHPVEQHKTISSLISLVIDPTQPP